MKAVKSFDVMESFGMKEMNPEELMEVDGGSCPTVCPSLGCLRYDPPPQPPCIKIIIGR